MFQPVFQGKKQKITGIKVCVILGIICLLLSVSYLIKMLNQDDQMKIPFAMFLASTSGMLLLFCIFIFWLQKKYQERNAFIDSDMNLPNSLQSHQQVFQVQQVQMTSQNQNQYYQQQQYGQPQQCCQPQQNYGMPANYSQPIQIQPNPFNDYQQQQRVHIQPPVLEKWNTQSYNSNGLFRN